MSTGDNNDHFRSTLAQVLAAVGFSTICVTLGLVLGMPMIVIGALRTDEKSLIHFSEEQASWFGSLLYILQPVGCVLSAFLQDLLGRKRCLVLVNIPMLVAWILLYYASSVTHLFVAITLMGISMGFMEAPILSYIGEVTQPRLRGLLSSCGGFWYNVGYVTEIFMGANMHWKEMVLYSIIGPAVAITVMSQVPESPSWLVSKGRIREAEKSFQWLRGWVRPEDVKDELHALVTYVKDTQTVKAEYVTVPNVEGGEQPTLLKTKSPWKCLLEPGVLAALRIVLIFFFVSSCVSLSAIRPFLIEILAGLQLPIRSHMVVVVCVILKILGALSLGVGLKLTGKRTLSFLSVGISSAVCLGLAAYLWTGASMPWLLVALFALCYFCGSFGVIPLPWILVMELFPLRVRGLASGLTGAFGYLTMFLVIKVYYTMEALVGVAGVCCVYGVVGLLGIVYLYRDLPETEGVTLEEIERRMARGRSARRQGVKQ